MEPNTNAGDGGQQGDEGKAGEGFKPITSQADLDRLIGERIARERNKFADYDDVKAKAAKFDEAEQASKSELERIAEERDAIKSRADKAESDFMRLFVAHNKGLTPAQAKRLVGSTKEELEADADEILRDFPTSSTGQQRQAVAPASLKSGSAASPDTGEKGRAAAALRSLRNS